MARVEFIGVKTADDRGRERLKDFNLSLEEGDAVILLGDDASGVGDVASAVIGRTPLSAGTLRIGDTSFHGTGPPPSMDVVARLGAITKGSGSEVLARTLSHSGLPDKEIQRRVRTVMDALEIADRPSQSFLDWWRRMRLAANLIREPAAVLLPSVWRELPHGVTQSQVLEAIHEIRNTTFLVAPPAAARRVAEQAVVVRDGAITQAGTATEVYERPRDLYAASAWGSGALALTTGRWNGSHLETDIGRMELPREAATMLAEHDVLTAIRPAAADFESHGHERLDMVYGHELRPAIRQAVEAAGIKRSDWSTTFYEAIPTRPDSRVLGQVDPSRILFFDAGTGENLLGDLTIFDRLLPSVEMGAVPDEPTATSAPGGPPAPPAPPAPPPGGGGDGGPEGVRRYLNTTSPPRVKPNTTFHIKVQVTMDASAGGHQFDTPAIPAQGVDLFVALDVTDGFEVENEPCFTLHLPQRGNSEERWFFVKSPAEPGRYVLTLTVVRGHIPAIQHEIEVDVSTQPALAAVPASPTPLPETLPTTDLSTLVVQRSGMVQTYTLLQGSEAKVVSKKVFDFDPSEGLRNLTEMLSWLAGTSRQAPSRIPGNLQGYGQELWEDFIPEDLGRQLTTDVLQTQALGILALESAPTIPWEMLYPPQPIHGGDDDFLSQLLPTFRYLVPPRSFDHKLPIKTVALVAPDSNLTDALSEIEQIKIIFGRMVRILPVITEASALEKLWDDGGFNVLHIASHTTKGSDAALQMAAGQVILPVALNKLAPNGGRWAKDGPLVFFNACGTDQPQPSFTRLESWAQRFSKAGASAFIGSMWDIRSSSAGAFAQNFYKAFITDRLPIAMAIQAARKRLRAQSSDPTWLAYAVHGDYKLSAELPPANQ